VRPHLATLVEEFRRHPAETAVVAHRGNRRYPTTYGQLADLTGRCAAELDRRGLQPGDRLLLWGENSAEWIAVFFACLLRGVIAVPLDAAGTASFATRVLHDVSPKLIAGDRNLLTSLANSASELARLVLSDLHPHLPVTPNYTVSAAVTRETPFQIVFTSGTTSDPKGIVHTHGNVLASLQPIEDEIAHYRKYERIFHPLRFLHSLPLSHVFGQFMGLWCPALLAAELHFSDQLEPARMTHLIRRERISVLIAVPRVLQLLRTHLLGRFPALAAQLEPAPDPASEPAQPLPVWKRWWRFRQVHRALGWKFWAVISGGATLPAELESFWRSVGIALIQGYGMTETAALVTLNHPFRIAHGTIGKALPGREIRLTDQGEILVRGDMLADSTWQAGALRPRLGDWLATGDLAAQEPSGELRYLGRMGDLIVTAAGMNIHPADLEAAMQQQPGVRACVVVPCDTPTGPEPVAVVQLSSANQSANAQLEAALRNANRSLAEYQQIRRALLWPELQFPYTSTGKLLRRKVAEWACAALAAQNPASAATTPSQDPLLQIITEITSEPPAASADPSHLRLSEDLHLDSLGRVQLRSALEQRLGLELTDDAIATVDTLGALRSLLEQPTEPPPHPIPQATQATHPSGESSAEIPGNNPPHPYATPHPAPEEPTYPHWPWSRLIQALRVAFLELIMRPLVWLLAAPRVTRDPALSELPTGPLLIIANHVTAYDGALILYALPPRLRRRVAAAMSGEMLLDLRRGRNQPHPLLNPLAPAAYWLLTALFNVFPLPRLRGFRSSFDHAGEAMDRNYSVLVFPEGRRSPTGHLQPFRPGIGLLAQQSQVPILPIALVGLGELRQRTLAWFRSGRLEIRLGAPIPPNPASPPEQLTRKLEAAIQSLLAT